MVQDERGIILQANEQHLKASRRETCRRRANASLYDRLVEDVVGLPVRRSWQGRTSVVGSLAVWHLALYIHTLVGQELLVRT